MHLRAFAIAALSVTLAAGCRSGRAAVEPRREPATAALMRAPWSPFSADRRLPPPIVSRAIACGDLERGRCAAACADRTSARDHAECVLDVRWADDPEAREVAQELFERTGTIVGVDPGKTIDGAHLGRLPIAPAAPTGPYRHHATWIARALERYERVFSRLREAASRPIVFQTRPLGFRFYRTERRSFPSAWAQGGVVGYNVEGALYDDEDTVTATLFHEVFHLNDEAHGGWSKRALGRIFAAIVARCEGDHACLERYAPDETTVDRGTFYAFDRRTGSAVEYAAELALRYFREHEALLTGADVALAFKCQSADNASAWSLTVDEFFGGVDLVPACDSVEP